MSAKPSRETADKIKQRIKRLDWFLYLATANSASSKWCPWEIGYADGVKGINRIVVIPTRDSAGRRYGSEYLDLYKRVSTADVGGLGIFGPNNRGTLFENVAP